MKKALLQSLTFCIFLITISYAEVVKEVPAEADSSEESKVEPASDES